MGAGGGKISTNFWPTLRGPTLRGPTFQIFLGLGPTLWGHDTHPDPNGLAKTGLAKIGLANIGRAKTTMAKNGLARIGQIRMAKTGLAKVGSLPPGWGVPKVGGVQNFALFCPSPTTSFALFLSHCVSSR